MTVIICPGVHPDTWTDDFLESMGRSPSLHTHDWIVARGSHVVPYCGVSLFHTIHHQIGKASKSPLLFIAFSAGVVGAIAAAYGFQQLGYPIRAFLALDGWGMPLYATFPIHRVSHDAFTHTSSSWLGAGQVGFYADPPVPHEGLWRSPHATPGWQTDHPFTPTVSTHTTAHTFILNVLHQGNC
jgi:hypothetical protein